MSGSLNPGSSRPRWLAQHFGITFSRRRDRAAPPAPAATAAPPPPAPPPPQPDPAFQALDMARATLAEAGRALAAQDLATALPLLRGLEQTLSAPDLRPRPDDRADAALAPAERTARAMERVRINTERRALLQDWQAQLRTAMQGPQGGGGPAPQGLDPMLAAAERELLLCDVVQDDPLRAALAKDHLVRAMQAIEAKLDPAVAAAHRPAVLASLGGALTRLLDPILAEALWQHQTRPGGPGEHAPYAESMQPLLRDPQPLFTQFPGLQERLQLETTNFTDGVIEVLDRAAQDKAAIEQRLLGGQATHGLKDIALTSSDPHNGGRRVMILTFEGAAGEDLRVVHKPRDVRVDAGIVGRSAPGEPPSLSEQAARLMLEAEMRRLRALETGDLQADAQLGLLRIDHDPATDTTQVEDLVPGLAAAAIPPLPTYGFLPMQDQQDHRYGWVEFVTHGRPEDCVLDHEGAARFYDCAGQVAGLAFLCGVEDLHHGNLLVREGLPVLTDLEIAFSSRSEPAAGFDPLTAPDAEVAAYVTRQLRQTLLQQGLGSGAETVHPPAFVAEDRLHPATLNAPLLTDNTVLLREPDGTLRPQTDGLPGEFADSFAAGFRRLCAALGDPALQAQHQAMLNGFQGMDVRFHALATGEQLRMRRFAMMVGYTRSIAAEETDLAQRLQAAGSDMAQRLARRPWLAAAIPAMAADLARRDVAYFTQPLGTRELRPNSGTALQHNGTTALLPNDGLTTARRNLQLMIHRPDILVAQAEALVRGILPQGVTHEMRARLAEYAAP